MSEYETLLSDEGGVFISSILRNNQMHRRIGDLASLESFAPEAFEGDAKVSQDVCNFVLTLALIFNDLKDLVFAQVTLQSQKPDDSFKVTRLWGEYCGVDLHLWKLMVSLFHEIVKLIEKSEHVIADPFFQSVIKGLRRKERDIWSSLVDAARGMAGSGKSKFALLIRNKVVFHYDPKEIYRGYKTFFTSGAPGAQRAFISRGNDMEHTRLFFADAAVTGYLMAKGEGKFEELMSNVIISLTDLNFVLTGIVDTFIQKRKYAYRKEADKTL